MSDHLQRERPGTLVFPRDEQALARERANVVVDAAYRAYSPAIRGKAMQLTHDPEVAADVTQEAFLRLFMEIQAGRSPDNVRAWLYRASANLIVSRARHAAVVHRIAPVLAPLDSPTQPDAIAIHREDWAEMHRALMTLSATDRTALRMAAAGATGTEIARSVQRSDVATRTLLSRARTRLRSRVAVGVYP